MFSFLFTKEANRGITHNSFNDLHIDELIDYIEKDSEAKVYIRNILEDFENDYDTIIYRQEVIKDFIKNNGLYDDLCSYFKRSIFIGDTYRAIKKDNVGVQKFFSTYNSDNYDTIGTILRRYCSVLIDIINLYKSINKYLHKYKFESKALIEFNKIITDVINNKATEELIELLERIINMKGTYDCLITLNDRFSVLDSCIILDYKPEVKKEAFSLFKKKASWVTTNVDVNDKTIFEMDHFINIASIKIIDLLCNAFEKFYDVFSNTAREMQFINFAINYEYIIKKLGLTYCYPEFNNDIISYTDLSDPYLAIKAYNENGKIIEVTSNSFLKTKDDGGVLVVGENNTGKTVYTRSLGISQILAQSGLMLTAKQANIRILKQIITCYASKESHEFDGGRFETEVRSLKYILDKACDNTFIIVNEIFQSTAYDEGCDALYNVLSYMTYCGICWICVSHFVELKDKKKDFFDDTNKLIRLMRTNVVEEKNIKKYHINTIE